MGRKDEEPEVLVVEIKPLQVFIFISRALQGPSISHWFSGGMGSPKIQTFRLECEENWLECSPSE